jgi:hypothetical protein
MNAAVSEVSDDGSSNELAAENAATSRRVQIKNLRGIPTSSGMNKILLTVNGCTCKAIGEKAD